MEIPKKVKQELDKLYEANDNPDYVVDYKGQYLPKKGDVFTIRHYHHIDQDRSNNELWNLVPLSYNDHIIEIHSKNNKEIKEKIYERMRHIFPEKEEHYRKYLLD
jgi:hypothetical protein|nr:MAG TPA: hypothetical protein [Caudoviricetes sp.]